MDMSPDNNMVMPNPRKGAGMFEYHNFLRIAAMAMMIVYTSAAVRFVHWLATRGLARRSQAWRGR